MALLILAGCKAAPTRVSETQFREFGVVIDKSKKPIVLTEETALLDTRSAFEFGLNRVENSLSLPALRGEALSKDARKAALKLSLYGLNPKVPVVVLGHGLKGQGEEGYLAWQLLHLGFDDVQVAALDLFRERWTQAQTPTPRNTPLWQPALRSGLEIDPSEVRVALKKTASGEPLWLIDVRSPLEAPQIPPSPSLVRLEWKEFYSADGRPDPSVLKKLEALKIRSTDRLVLISNRGVRSGAAAYALLALGWPRVQNCTAGWNSVLKN